jgi:viroplasmin and RNaseH domain-containing protein
MQITNNTNYTSPNFTALKSVKYKGLYRKYPELGRNLLKTFLANEEASKFMDIHDVDVVFNSRIRHKTGTTSSIHMIYDEPRETPLRKFINLFRHKKEIALRKYENDYSISASIQASTEKLQDSMMPKGSSCSRYNGILGDLINKVMDR